MMPGTRRVLILTLCLAALAVSLADAQGGYDDSWWAVDGGGGRSEGGTCVLSGTAGQAEAAVLMQGGSYGLAAGFWGGAGAGPSYPGYLPAVMKQYP